jgi:hypothetical protein
MRGLTPAERRALLEMTEDPPPDETRGSRWPWPESVVSRLLKDGRAHIFICPHCSLAYGGIVEHIDVTNLGRMALRIVDMPVNITV